MKNINDQFRELGLYCTEALLDEIREYTNNYDEDLINQNIEIFMDANRNLMNINQSEHKKIGKLWKLAQEIYLSNLLDVCRENSFEGEKTRINTLTYQKAYDAALKSRKNLRKQLNSGKSK